MSIPQELKDQLVAQFQSAQISAMVQIVGDIAGLAFDAGVSSVEAGGFSQEQLDAAVAEGKGIEKVRVIGLAQAEVDNHDANTKVDQDLKDAIGAIV